MWLQVFCVCANVHFSHCHIILLEFHELRLSYGLVDWAGGERAGCSQIALVFRTSYSREASMQIVQHTRQQQTVKQSKIVPYIMTTSSPYAPNINFILYMSNATHMRSQFFWFGLFRACYHIIFLLHSSFYICVVNKVRKKIPGMMIGYWKDAKL